MEHRTLNSITTGIHTRINDKIRISSAWRTYGNEYFSSQAWETFLWDGDRIIGEYNTLRDANDVINLHLEIVESKSWVKD